MANGGRRHRLLKKLRVFQAAWPPPGEGRLLSGTYFAEMSGEGEGVEEGEKVSLCLVMGAL